LKTIIIGIASWLTDVATTAAETAPFHGIYE